MDDELWFEEEIFPAESTVDGLIATVKSLTPDELADLTGDQTLATLTKGQQAAYARQLASKELHGIVRAHRPAARLAGSDAAPFGEAATYALGIPYLIRLGIEFDFPDDLKKTGNYRYKKIWCRAWVSAPEGCEPRVLDILPDRLYVGEPRKLQIEVKPELKLAEVGGSLGSVSTGVEIGVVAPATTGWMGEAQRAPYWEMTEAGYKIEGRYNFWFLIDVPTGCDPASVRLGMLGEGDFQLHKRFTIAAGPIRRERHIQQTVTLQSLLS